jgi:hypothetical protein
LIPTASVEHDSLRFTVDATNCGRSAALLTHGFVSAEWVRRGKESPETPDYSDLSDDPESEYARRDWVLPGATVNIGDENPAGIIDQELLKRFEDSEMIMWIFCRLRYEDSVSGTKYEERFCYRCSWIFKKPRLFGGGPPAI